MDTTQLILIGLAVLIFGSNYVKLGGVWDFLKDKLSGLFGKSDDSDAPVSEGEFCLVDATSKFVELRNCLVHGDKKVAVEELDKVFPLMNEE